MPIEFRDGIEVVTCPCCKDKRELVVYEETWPSFGLEKAYTTECTHCMGEGYVPAKS